MKATILLLAVCVALVSCGDGQKSSPFGIVVDKTQAVEQRYQMDWLGKDTVSKKSTTIYYLILQSGDVVEVDLKTWARVQKGEMWKGR